ncbi:hypothetical protein [Actinokineospora iranica]|uniref:Uncharacterized protein n=1 Tax=Actinokineospora iranica TaxID=1271860 RepID=A0A1G6WQZ6_9PSEU|nr:hypothetical protein [Actinokineospora iranica]SDD68370.1 hypothetical protein SAMN05216174_115135 [Actinokineospora iranica]
MSTGDDPMRVVYRDRAHLIALLATVFPARVETDPAPDRADCSAVVVLELPTGQVSWHVHDEDLSTALFGHLPMSWDTASWDGHSVADKHARITAQITAVTGPDTAASLCLTARCGTCETPLSWARDEHPAHFPTPGHLIALARTWGWQRNTVAGGWTCDLCVARATCAEHGHKTDPELPTYPWCVRCGDRIRPAAGQGGGAA